MLGVKLVEEYEPAVGYPDYWRESYGRALPRDGGALYGADIGPPDGTGEGGSARARIPSVPTDRQRYANGDDIPSHCVERIAING
eukprot:1353748-Pyramimonas_sp.AAC.2